jgi:predicted nucleotidyltransferase
MTNDASRSTLSRDEIIAALSALAAGLGDRGVTGEICLFGGAVMVLAFNARVMTKDVDAIFKPAGLVREVAREVGNANGWPEDWLNDGVKGFVSSQQHFTAGNLPQFPNLRLTMPVPEYLLAMKCIAARIAGTGDEVSDVADVVFLIRRIGLASAAEVLKLVAQYYPREQIGVKTQYLIEGLFEEGQI